MALTSEERTSLLALSGDVENEAGIEARRIIAKEFASADSPVLETIAQETTVRNIFAPMQFDYDQQIEFITDIPKCAAYDMPKLGQVPRAQLEGDIILLSTFQVVGEGEWTLRQARGKRLDIIKRTGVQVGESIARKEEDAGWTVLIHAGNSNWSGAGAIGPLNAPIVQVPDAAGVAGGAGFFSKELINLMSIHMERLGKALTHIYISPEDMGDVRTWSYVEVDPLTRNVIFNGGGLGSVWDINLVKTRHLGLGATGYTPADAVSNENYGTATSVDTTIGAYNMTSNVNPITGETLNNTAVSSGYTQVYGFDLRPNYRERHFVMPQRGGMIGHDNPNLISELKAGVIVEEEIGFSVLDNRAIVVGNVNRNIT